MESKRTSFEPSVEQKQVISHRGGHLQVIACAGSGKTEEISRRVAARIVPDSLAAARMALEAGERSARGIEDLLRTRIGQEPLARLEYASVVDLDELQPVGTIDGPVLVAVAVRFGATRLIDNFRFEPPAPHSRR